MSVFDKIGADRLADEVAALVTRRVIDMRSPAADALLDYRNPPRTERSDALVQRDREIDRLRTEIARLLPVHAAAKAYVDLCSGKGLGYGSVGELDIAARFRGLKDKLQEAEVSDGRR